MRKITEQQIQAFAPNANAVSKGRKLLQDGQFIRLNSTLDDTFFQGECTGSGSKNYLTSVDFITPDTPVFRCACPSRQYPCKHCIGLLYAMFAQRPFHPFELPDDIAQKRAKKTASLEKTAAAKASKEIKNADTPVKKQRTNRAAQIKKLKKQQEGLQFTRKLLNDFMHIGLGAMGGIALDNYRGIAKQLGDYYLPGPQQLLNRLILEIEQYQRDQQDCHYENAIQAVEALWSLVKKADAYIAEKLESGESILSDTPLYEELGGVWKLTELTDLGLCKKNVRVAQLAFWVSFDEARKEYIDTGCWGDLENGEITLSCNYRPVKALKYIKQENSVFGVFTASSACYYPRRGNRRIRWESAQLNPLEPSDITALKRFASPLSQHVKQVKNILKDPLASPLLFACIPYTQIAQSSSGLVLQDIEGNAILLADAPQFHPTTNILYKFGYYCINQVLFGGFWYDSNMKRINFQPISILTDTRIIRLLY